MRYMGYCETQTRSAAQIFIFLRVLCLLPVVRPGCSLLATAKRQGVFCAMHTYIHTSSSCVRIILADVAQVQDQTVKSRTKPRIGEGCLSFVISVLGLVQHAHQAAKGYLLSRSTPPPYYCSCLHFALTQPRAKVPLNALLHGRRAARAFHATCPYSFPSERALLKSCITLPSATASAIGRGQNMNIDGKYATLVNSLYMYFKIQQQK